MNVTGLPDAEARRECQRLSRSTVPQIFAERVAQTPHSVALRYKDRGIYRELTWAQYHARVQDIATALVMLAIVPGGRIAIAGLIFVVALAQLWINHPVAWDCNSRRSSAA